MLATVEKLPPPALRADFSIRVLQSFDDAQHKVQKDIHRRWTWAISALASAAAVLLTVYSWRDRPPAVRSLELPYKNVQPLAAIDYQQILADAETITSQHGAWVTELAEGLKPVTSSVNSALHTLWRKLPTNELALVLL